MVEKEEAAGGTEAQRSMDDRKAHPVGVLSHNFHHLSIATIHFNGPELTGLCDLLKCQLLYVATNG